VAAAAGKHVITEKPMAITLDGVDRMIGACRDAGVALCVQWVLGPVDSVFAYTATAGHDIETEDPAADDLLSADELERLPPAEPDEGWVRGTAASCR
jgi:hypothetical protein